eukprot:8132205-Pyramimonas_sp.AAC.1
MRLQVDAWNGEAFVWSIESAHVDRLDWRVPAARAELPTAATMIWSQCNDAAIALCHGVWRSWGAARYNYNRRTAASLTRDAPAWA